MVKPAWGMKRTCQGCGAHFYDLQKDPIICPKCATVYDPDAVSRTRRGRSSAAPKPAPRVPVPEIAEAPGEPVAPELEEAGLEIAAEEGEAEGEDVTIEDPEDLPEDDADVTEVIENVEEEER